MTLIFKFDMHLPWIKGWNSGRLIILHPNLNEIYHLDSLQKTVYTNYNLYVSLNEKQIIVLNKKCHLTIQITNDRPVYVLPLVNYNVQWPFIGYLYCMTSLFIRHYESNLASKVHVNAAAKRVTLQTTNLLIARSLTGSPFELRLFQAKTFHIIFLNPILPHG